MEMKDYEEIASEVGPLDLLLILPDDILRR